MRRLLDVFRSADLPLLARRNFVAERQQMFLWGIVAGSVEGPIASVVASKTFAAPPLLTTLIYAIPVSVNLLNLVWGLILRGRPRLRASRLLISGVCLGVASIGLNDARFQPWAAYLFAAQIAFTHLFISGLINLRTTMWRANYPQSHRAQIAGRLQTLLMLLGLCSIATLSVLFDADPQLYRFVYPAVAAIGLLSLIPMSHMRMRGERSELHHFREHIAALHRRGDHHIGLWSGLREAGGILRHDRAFARFMAAQFLLGAANFLTDPVLVNVLTKELALSYYLSTLLLQQIPLALLLLSIPTWARYFDRVGIVRFRIINSAIWAAAYAGVLISMALLQLGGSFLWPALGVLLIARGLKGVGWGGGAIAWNIGHLHFAKPHQTELYMGIHVGLTGLRGLIMPPIGWVLYYYLGGAWVAFALLLAVISYIMFRRLALIDAAPLAEATPHTAEPGSPRTEVT